jgi:protein gp37
MNKTDIEYLTHTWNPIAMRCTRVSAGCKECWHLSRAAMLAKNPSIPKDHQAAYAGHSGPVLVKSRLNELAKRRKYARIGVQFMGDLFHDNVPEDYISDIYNVIYDNKHLDFLILTKREERLSYFHAKSMFLSNDPIINLWLGVSVEDPDNLWRVKELLKIPAAVRFLSAEPMLDYLDLTSTGYIDPYYHLDDTYRHVIRNGMLNRYQADSLKRPVLDWVIAGPETGPRARPCPPGAIENLAEQCYEANIPFFDKRPDFIAREFPKPRSDIQ